MLGEVVTQTGTPWRPKRLAIERPLRFPPKTNAPVVSVMGCPHHRNGIIRVQQRVAGRPEPDSPQLSPRCGGAVRVKRSAYRQQTASKDRNSKWQVLQGSAISAQMPRTLRSYEDIPESLLSNLPTSA